MVINRKRLVALATAGAMASLAACGGGSTNDNATDDNASAEGAKGGTLNYLTTRSTEHLDPQRTYIGRDLSNMSRIAIRNLVTFPATENEDEALTPVPDLATDTGTMSKDAKTWSFTLKDGVKWEDGSDITCEDVKYGASRTFATDVITGGPNYILSFLDVPKDKTGLPLYNGPYKKKNQADFDKAVTCDGKTITYRFSKPFPDFPLAISSLLSFAPFKQSEDQGDKSNFAVFSSGPYKLESPWKSGKGGTFVRNENWDPATDDVRKALPDKIVFTEGLESEIMTDRLVADSGEDQTAVTDRSIPPSAFSQITGPVADRAVQVDSPFVSYLLPNFNQMKNLQVRQALMMSTDNEGQISALGGTKAGAPAKSIVAPDLVGYTENPEFTAPASGDPEAAKKLLQESGETLPYPIKFTYNGGTPTSDKMAAALQDGWEKAGFKVSLDPLGETYYDVINKPTNDADVMWAAWGADWPSIATVIPPLFDSRVNLTSESNGNDYGNYRSDKVNQLIDKAASLPTVEEQAEVYAQIDEQLGKDVAYIPLENTQFYMLRGSKVTGYVTGPGSNGYPDLGLIGVTS
ncbi:MAG TPA: ABC transporter substrate-binding protein [Nocardioidaceae bacterium]|nr:ABC transporter substrate-binding protein [Nocardioidaceae bacterium]